MGRVFEWPKKYKVRCREKKEIGGVKMGSSYLNIGSIGLQSIYLSIIYMSIFLYTNPIISIDLYNYLSTKQSYISTIVLTSHLLYKPFISISSYFLKQSWIHEFCQFRISMTMGKIIPLWKLTKFVVTWNYLNFDKILGVHNSSIHSGSQSLYLGN